MQQALPYRDWLADATASGRKSTSVRKTDNTSPAGDDINGVGAVKKRVAENAVVVFARSDCCMCHVVKLLLHGHGVSPSVFDVDEVNEDDVVKGLSGIMGSGGSWNSADPKFPAVFVGGRYFGGLEEIMGAHISGELVPRLREARALWL